MRYRGREYTGEGITVAVIDSGIDASDPRLAGMTVEGWSIQLGATGHAMLGANFDDENGHGTNMAAAVAMMAPGCRLLGVKIMDERLRTSADLMAAGIETSFRAGAQVISLSLGTPNMGKALLLRDCCALAVEHEAIVLAAAHPKGDRAYPADLPETIGVATHPDCPIDKFYYFSPHRFPRSQWGNLTGKYLTHGYEWIDGDRGAFKGSGIATAFLAGRIACLRHAMPGESAMNVVETLRQLALTPVPEIGYA